MKGIRIRLRQNPLFLGIRQGRLHLGLDSPDYIANLQRLADADCSLDVDTPRQGMTAPDVLPQSESLEFNSYPNVFGVARAYVRRKGPV